MGFSDEEKRKKTDEVKQILDKVLEGKPYVFLLTVLYESDEKAGKSVSSSFWGVRHIGNVDILKAPFPVVNGLIKATVETFNSFIKSFSDMSDEAGENDKQKI